MRCDEPFAGRIEADVAGDLAFDGDVLNDRELSCGGIAGEDGDGVMRAVADVNETTVRMRDRLGGAESLFAAIGFRQRGNGFDFGERTFFGVVGEDGFGHGHFVVHEDVFAARVKREVTRATTSGHFGKGGIIRDHLACGGVDLVDEHLVQAEIACEGEAVVGAEVHRMRMRPGLTLRISPRAFMLEETRGLRDGTVVFDRIGSDAAAAVVRDRGQLARFIDVHMAGAGTDSARLIDRREFAGGLVDGEGTDAAALFAVR